MQHEREEQHGHGHGHGHDQDHGHGHEPDAATFFDEVAATWDDDPKRAERATAIADAIRASVPLTRQMSGFEFGSGTALLSRSLAPDLGPITVSDPSRGMLEVVAQRLAAEGDTQLTPLLLELGVDPIPGGAAYDLAYGMLALHHVDDVPAALRSLRAALRPGGYLCIADLDADGGAYHAGHSHFHGHHGFDREALAAQLIEGGFVDPHLRTVYHLRKPVDGVEQDFPLFLAVAQVGQVGQAGPDRA